MIPIFVTVLSLLLGQPHFQKADKLYQTNAYSISYPENWIIDSSRQIADAIYFKSPLVGVKDDFSENINILEQDLGSEDFNLEAYKEISEEQFKEMDTLVTLINSEVVKAPSGDKYYSEYLLSLKNRKMHIKSYCYIKNSIAYLITFSTAVDTFDLYEETGTKILDSFQLK